MGQKLHIFICQSDPNVSSLLDREISSALPGGKVVETHKIEAIRGNIQAIADFADDGPTLLIIGTMDGATQITKPAIEALVDLAPRVKVWLYTDVKQDDWTDDDELPSNVSQYMLRSQFTPRSVATKVVSELSQLTA